MTVVRVRLCEADREQYGAPEELVLDVEVLKDLEADELEKIDSAMRMPLAVFVPQLEGGPLTVAHTGRVAVWLALREAGYDVAWEACTPKLLRAVLDRETIPGPPDGPSEPSSEDEAPSSSSEA